MKLTLPPIVTAAAIIALCVLPQSVRAATAGADFALNEKPDGGTDFLNPNATVPQWSYGYRASLTGTSLTLFTAGDHTDNFIGANDPMEGFYIHAGFSIPAVLVNTGAAPFTFNFGAGPVGPSEMMMHGDAGLFAVTRYTIPANGLYSGSASFRAIHTGDVDVHVVVNGTSIFDQVLNPGQSASPTLGSTPLLAGDVVDFLVGVNGSVGGDSTAFDATIVPEPASVALLALGGFALLARRRHS